MNLSERTASLAGQPVPGSHLCALQAEVTRRGAALRFSDPALEADYFSDRATGCAAQARGGLLLTIVLIVLFLGLHQFAFGPVHPWRLPPLALAVLLPVLSAAWIAMRLGRCRPWIVQINIAALVIVGLTFAWVIPHLVITPDRVPYASEALLLYVAVLYFLSGAMFHAATTIALVMSVVFLVAIGSSAVTPAVVGYSSFFLVAFNLVCAIGRYMLDKTYRRNFLTRMIAVELAERDPLTGIFNRRVFAERLDVLLRQSARDRTSLSLLVLDIDHFKRINDTGGHALGDSALRVMGDALQGVARRPLDAIARLGGDEFAALWLSLPADQIEARVNELLAGFIARSEALNTHVGSRITLSIGVAHATDTREHTAESLLHAADAALYRAKAAGRDCVKIETL